jgi:hypothetical protein
LEAKVSETKEQYLEALKVTKGEKSKDVIEDQSHLSLVVRCVTTLQAKLDKTLVSKVTFVIGPKIFNKPMNRPHKNHKFCKKKTIVKANISVTKVIVQTSFVTIRVTPLFLEEPERNGRNDCGQVILFQAMKIRINY